MLDFGENAYPGSGANVADAIKQEKADSVDGGDVVTTVTQVVDHDYFVGYSAPSTAPSGPTPAKRAKISILTPSQNKPFVVKEVRFENEHIV